MKKLLVLLALAAPFSSAQNNFNGYAVPETGIGLSFRLGPGTCANNAGTIVTYPGGAINLAANSITFGYLDSNCAINQNGTGYIAGSIPLFQATTNGTDVTKLVDTRVSYSFPSGAGTGSVSPIVRSSAQTGATSDVQISNAISALPAGGGIVWADYSTNQTWAACPTFGAGNVHIVMFPASYTIAVNCTIPANVTLEFEQGAKLAPATGKTVIVAGSTLAGNRQQIVNTANGTVQFTGSSRIYVAWYGAIQDLIVDDALGTQIALDSNQGKTIYMAASIPLPCSASSGGGCVGAPGAQFLTPVIMRKNDTTLAVDTSQSWPDGGLNISVPNVLGTPAIFVNQNCYGCGLEHIHLTGPTANAWNSSDSKTFINPSQSAMDGLDNDGIAISGGLFRGKDIGASNFLRHGILICGTTACDAGQPDYWKIDGTYNASNRGWGTFVVGGDSGGGLGINVNGRGNGFGEVGDWNGAGGGGNTWVNMGDELSARNTLSAGSTQAITSCTVTSNVDSCTTTAGNTFQQNSWVTMSGFTDTTFNGTCKLTSATNANPFTCAFTHADGTASAGSPVVGTASATSIWAQISSTHSSGVAINVGKSFATGGGNVQILGGFGEPQTVSFGIGTIVQGLIVVGGTILSNQQNTTIATGTTGTTVAIPSTPGTANFNIIDAEDQPGHLNLQPGISSDQNFQILWHGFDSTPGDVSGATLYSFGTVSDTLQMLSSAGLMFFEGANATKDVDIRGLAVGSGNINLQKSAGSGVVNFYGGGAGVVASVDATGKGTFNGGVTTPAQLASTVATGTAPLVVSSTTQVANLNVGTVDGVTITGTPSAGQVPTATSASAATWQTPAFAAVVYSTPSAATTSSIGTTTMATAGGSGNTYRVNFYATETVLGSGCTGGLTTNLTITLAWDDPNEAVPTSNTIGKIAINGNGTLGRLLTLAASPAPPISQLNEMGLLIVAKPSTAVQYTTTYAPDGGCSPAPTYKIYPIVEQLN